LSSPKSKPLLRKITVKEEWDKVLTNFSYYDCYHTYDYHLVGKKIGEQPLLLYYKAESVLIALPLLKRPIRNTNYYDLTSVYGYAGPILGGKITKKEFVFFQNELRLFCEKEDIVSIFTRLNPYINGQVECLEGIGETIKVGDIVNVNLTKTLAEQRSDYSSTTKRYVNKARKLCTIKKSNSKEDIQIFKNLYHENMSRVNADDYYFFSEKYFFDILSSESFKTEVVYAVLNETQEIISGVITIKTKNITHYHLSGTSTKHLKINPLRLLLDELRISATNEKQLYLNLGGGLGAKNDALFSFKSSFSKEYKEFKVWKFIANEKAYNSLLKNTEGSSTFFPAYRYMLSEKQNCLKVEY
jgi:hypothetical protein